MKYWIQIFSLSQLEKLNLDKYDYIYWGTETCIFKKSFDNEKIGKDYLKKYNKLLNWKKLVYVSWLLPKFIEEKYFKFLEELIEVYQDNLEITINDWWIYNFLKKKKYLWKIKINIWTNLYYHVKDPYASVIKPEKFIQISIDRQFYNNFFKKLGFNWNLEFYYPKHWIDFKYISFPKTLYFPYVQYSFTRACPWSLEKAWEKVSKLVLDCGWCDRKYYSQQVKQKLKWKDLLVESIYVPNAQYYDVSKYINLEDIKKNIDIDVIIDNSLLVKKNKTDDFWR